MQTQGLINYLTHLAGALPGGVDCAECHLINTYAHVSLKWKDLGENKYSFRQTVECEKCGHTHVYQWEQNVRPDFRVTMSDNVQTETGG
jgi:ribosomal protein S14